VALELLCLLQSAPVGSVCSDLLRTVSGRQQGLRDELEGVKVEVLVAIDEWR